MITPNGKICWPLTEVGTLQLPFCDITVLLKNRVPGTKYCHFNFDPNIIIHYLQYYWPSGDHLINADKQVVKLMQSVSKINVNQETIIDKLAYYTLHTYIHTLLARPHYTKHNEKPLSLLYVFISLSFKFTPWMVC